MADELHNVEFRYRITVQDDGSRRALAADAAMRRSARETQSEAGRAAVAQSQALRQQATMYRQGVLSSHTLAGAQRQERQAALGAAGATSTLGRAHQQVVRSQQASTRATRDSSRALSDARREISGVTSGLGRMSSAAQRMAWQGVVGGTVAVAALGAAVATTGFRFDDMKQQSLIAFTTMLHSGKQAQVFFQQLATFAAKTPFELPDVLTGAKRLMAMGFAAKDVLPSLTAVGDAAAGLATGNEGIQRMITALGQMRNAGKVSAQDMNQLIQAGVPAWRYLAEAAHKSIAQVRKDSQNGMLDSRAAVQIIMAGMEKDFGGLMEKQSHTFSGLWSTIKDTFRIGTGNVVAPFFKDATGWLQRLANYSSTPEFQRKMTAWGRELYAYTMPRLQGIYTYVREHWPDIRDTIEGIAGTAKVFADNMLAVGRAVHDVTDKLGGTKTVAEGLFGIWSANKVLGLGKAFGVVAGASGIGKAIKAITGGAGLMAALRMLPVTIPITIAITAVLYRKQIGDALAPVGDWIARHLPGQAGSGTGTAPNVPGWARGSTVGMAIARRVNVTPERIAGRVGQFSAAEVNDIASQTGIPPALLAAIMTQESGGRQTTKSGALVGSPMGAQGVMQLMPATAKALGVNPRDAMENLMGGAKYLAQLIKAFKGDVQAALAAYNAGSKVAAGGPEAWKRALNTPGDPRSSTYNYVQAIVRGAQGRGTYTGGPGAAGGGQVPLGPSAGALSYPFDFQISKSMYGRPDQGWDIETGASHVGDPVRALGAGIVQFVGKAGAYGPSYVEYRITKGPLAGKTIFIGHARAKGGLRAGQTISAGQQLASLQGGPGYGGGLGHVEMGYAAQAELGSYGGPAGAGHKDPITHYTPEGAAFMRYLQGLTYGGTPGGGGGGTDPNNPAAGGGGTPPNPKLYLPQHPKDTAYGTLPIRFQVAMEQASRSPAQLYDALRKARQFEYGRLKQATTPGQKIDVIQDINDLTDQIIQALDDLNKPVRAANERAKKARLAAARKAAAAATRMATAIREGQTFAGGADAAFSPSAFYGGGATGVLQTLSPAARARARAAEDADTKAIARRVAPLQAILSRAALYTGGADASSPSAFLGSRAALNTLSATNRARALGVEDRQLATGVTRFTKFFTDTYNAAVAAIQRRDTRFGYRAQVSGTDTSTGLGLQQQLGLYRQDAGSLRALRKQVAAMQGQAMTDEQRATLQGYLDSIDDQLLQYAGTRAQAIRQAVQQGIQAQAAKVTGRVQARDQALTTRQQLQGIDPNSPLALQQLGGAYTADIADLTKLRDTLRQARDRASTTGDKQAIQTLLDGINQQLLQYAALSATAVRDGVKAAQAQALTRVQSAATVAQAGFQSFQMGQQYGALGRDTSTAAGMRASASDLASQATYLLTQVAPALNDVAQQLLKQYHEASPQDQAGALQDYITASQAAAQLQLDAATDQQQAAQLQKDAAKAEQELLKQMLANQVAISQTGTSIVQAQMRQFAARGANPSNPTPDDIMGQAWWIREQLIPSQEATLRYDMPAQLAEALQEGDTLAAQQMRAQMEDLRATIAEEWRQQQDMMVQARLQMAQDIVDKATHGESMIGYGYEALQLQQRLGGTYDQATSASARSAYINTQVIPAMQQELQALQAQQAQAASDGNAKLADQIAEAIAQKQNAITQEQIDALNEVAANTEPLRDFSGTLAFGYQGAQWTDRVLAGMAGT